MDIIERFYKKSVEGLNPEWLYQENLNWYNYIVSLPLPLQLTYTIVVLENQVMNGGFHQYFSNGYGIFANITIGHLKRIKALGKSKLLKEALEIIRGNDDNNTFIKKLINKEINELYLEDVLFEPFDKLDDIYYTSEENIAELLDKYLKNIIG